MHNPPLSAHLQAVQLLKANALSLSIDHESFQFKDTSELINPNNKTAIEHAWIAQTDAKTSAEFGLNIHQKGFNLLALGEPGTGRTSLMLTAMSEAAANKSAPQDLIALYQFDASPKPIFVRLPNGVGLALKHALDQFVRKLAKELARLMDTKATVKAEALAPIHAFLMSELSAIKKDISQIAKNPVLTHHFATLEKDVMECLDAWQLASGIEGDNNLESLLSESFFGRYRVNVLCGNAQTASKTKPKSSKAKGAAVIYDNDPSLQSLFGGIESAPEHSAMPEFLRLRAGNLLRADGGAILIQLRDILADEQNGAQILEKLHRFLRNGTVQIEDLSSGNGQSGSLSAAQSSLVVSVKVVLVATREDYYALLEETPEFFNFFPIKIEFAEKVKATPQSYAAYAAFIAARCVQFNCPHFTHEAVAALLLAMHRQEEDQSRLSTNFAVLEKLILESAAAAQLRNARLVEVTDIKAAIVRKYHRHSYIESHLRDSIIDNELMITVQGEAVGQVNGLTHIDLADASFGSPVRITANCYPGNKGVMTIDREVNMSGPTHDKGVMILQSWLQRQCVCLNPLSLTASIVFEQEYNGVDGDSASCAELFAILSALTNTPIRLGIAVTGALNQHGEVLPVGGLNEKIEGYFRVCKAMGLNGQQGVLIPSRNQQHLILSDDVIAAVKAGQFSIATMQHIEEGFAYVSNTDWNTVTEKMTTQLKKFKDIVESNLPNKHVQK